MTDMLVTVLLWFCALGCGLLAGLYFAFSAFILQAFDRLGPAQAAAAMNAINERILRSLFMPLFLGTTLAGLALAVIGLLGSGPVTMVAGGLVYALGMTGVTMAFNVPLNNALVAAPTETWPRFLVQWLRWNHVRTIASTLASALFIAAITAR